MHDFFCNYIWGSQELWISMRAVGVTVINFSALRMNVLYKILDAVYKLSKAVTSALYILLVLKSSTFI